LVCAAIAYSVIDIYASNQFEADFPTNVATPLYATSLNLLGVCFLSFFSFFFFFSFFRVQFWYTFLNHFISFSQLNLFFFFLN